MVPGLPSVTNRRDNAGMLADPMDDALQYNAQQRIPAQRGDQMLASPLSNLYNQQGPARGAIPFQHYRDGPSPVPNQGLVGLNPQQRLPPGLANLGGRPPHEPSHSHYLNSQIGMPPNTLHGSALANASPQSYNNFSTGAVGYNATPQLRGAPPGLHHLQNPLGHNQMSGLGPVPGNMDLRGPNQAQLLGLNAGLRGNAAGAFSLHQGPTGQVQNPVHLRQHQQQLPPHMMPQLVPPHHHHQGLSTPENQGAHDLMTLLMGGPHRG
jgi:hypothetical protein